MTFLLLVNVFVLPVPDGMGSLLPPVAVWRTSHFVWQFPATTQFPLQTQGAAKRPFSLFKMCRGMKMVKDKLWKRDVFDL